MVETSTDTVEGKGTSQSSEVASHDPVSYEDHQKVISELEEARGANRNNQSLKDKAESEVQILKSSSKTDKARVKELETKILEDGGKAESIALANEIDQRISRFETEESEVLAIKRDNAVKSKVTEVAGAYNVDHEELQRQVTARGTTDPVIINTIASMMPKKVVETSNPAEEPETASSGQTMIKESHSTTGPGAVGTVRDEINAAKGIKKRR